MFSTLCLTAALTFAAPADLQPTPAAEKQAAAAAVCVKTCADCQSACDVCFRHCAWKVLGGEKEHIAAMQMCPGCADACRFTSSLAARHSPMTCHAVECCLKCCADTAEVCEKFPDDRSMAECAKACRECARACKTMTIK